LIGLGLGVISFVFISKYVHEKQDNRLNIIHKYVLFYNTFKLGNYSRLFSSALNQLSQHIHLTENNYDCIAHVLKIIVQT
jgi:hypothetical protein